MQVLNANVDGSTKGTKITIGKNLNVMPCPPPYASMTYIRSSMQNLLPLPYVPREFMRNKAR